MVFCLVRNIFLYDIQQCEMMYNLHINSKSIIYLVFLDEDENRKNFCGRQLKIRGRYEPIYSKQKKKYILEWTFKQIFFKV